MRCLELIGLALILSACPSPAEAADDRPCADGFICSSVSVGGGGGGDGTPDAGGLSCRWMVVPFGLVWEDRDTVVAVAYHRLGNGGLGRTLADGRVQRAQRRVCDDGTPEGRIGPIQWSDVTSVADLVEASLVSVRRRVPLPESGMNPPVAVGGVVNLGMWLAVVNAEPVMVEARAGGLWARTTARLVSSRFEMGNGDTVVCEGAGTLLVEGDPGWDSYDEGPCGYTYTKKPPPDPYRVTITTTWEVGWVTSAGTSGSAPVIVRSSGFDYKVIEIQTIGVRG